MKITQAALTMFAALKALTARSKGTRLTNEQIEGQVGRESIERFRPRRADLRPV